MGQHLVAAKDDLRRRLLAARAARTAEARASAGVALGERLLTADLVAGARTVAAFVSFGAEPPTSPFLDACLATGVRVLVPLVRPAGVLDWAELDGSDLRPGGLGIPEPTGRPLGTSALSTADVVLVPALAVDPAGHRLGRGAGYYDRALAGLRDGVPRIAVVFDDELLPHVPTEPHDVPVTHHLTPSTPLTPTSSR
ncbi:MAG: 5-formyltetrahydrofolate cyclo-ligase [Nocardioidaceae bacterium]|nr:5-formyltetrahydrofolate cyclo-ligase [Nocardioidaceae bacterium]